MNHTSVADPAPYIRVPIALTVRETAAILRMHPGSVTRAYREGRLTGGPIGHKLLIDGQSVVTYLRAANIPAQVVGE